MAVPRSKNNNTVSPNTYRCPKYFVDNTWRATGMTIYLENDGRLEHAQQMAGQESPRATKLYDRTKGEIALSIERGGANPVVTFIEFMG